MKALVVDDDINVREGFVKLIGSICPSVSQIFQAQGVKTGAEAIRKHSPDIVFLDVEMEDGTGMDLVAKFSDINFQLIFITAFNKYAIEAFKFSAIDFLLKPISSDDLKRSVDRAVKNINNKNVMQQLAILQESLKEIKSEDKKIVLNDSESIHFIKVSEIVRCEADGGYTKFFFSNRKELLISSSLKEYEDLLVPYGFSRVHHSHLINLNKILRFDRKDGGFLVMENGEHVPISKRKKDELSQIIKQL